MDSKYAVAVSYTHLVDVLGLAVLVLQSEGAVADIAGDVGIEVVTLAAAGGAQVPVHVGAVHVLDGAAIDVVGALIVVDVSVGMDAEVEGVEQPDLCLLYTSYHCLRRDDCRMAAGPPSRPRWPGALRVLRGLRRGT